MTNGAMVIPLSSISVKPTRFISAVASSLPKCARRKLDGIMPINVASANLQYEITVRPAA